MNGQFPGFLVDALSAVAATDTANQYFFRYINFKAWLTNKDLPDPDKTPGLAPSGDALALQTIGGMAEFNNLVKKRPGTCYYASAGDADLNGDRELSPEEAEGMVPGGTREFARLRQIQTADGNLSLHRPHSIHQPRL